MSLESYILETGQKAVAASRAVATAGAAQKNSVLENAARLLRERADQILAANGKDLDDARSKGMDDARLDRLCLTSKTIEEMANACLEVAGQHDPVGAMESQWQRPNGLLVGRMRVPLGVVAMIYESRPNVTIEAAILCLKAGNSAILRGGSEAYNSNMILGQVLREALKGANLPPEAVQVLETTDRAAVRELCRLEQCVDVIIPRGGEGLIRSVCEMALMPVLKHFKGVCHAFVDASADLPQSLEIIYNGKVQRPGVCNALECLLTHKDIADSFLPMVGEKLGRAGVEFRACPASLPLLGETAKPQTPEDLGQEFHSLILAVSIVDDLDAALRHIAAYGSKHTEIICTADYGHALRFLREADASMVAVNASTRFNDGGQLGLGAEIGISTSKLHAFGPMGVKELTTTKFVIMGQGQVRES